MKEKTFSKFRGFQGVLLFIVNLYLISLSFTSFAPFGTFQFWGWAAVAFIVATMQLTFIMQIKTELKGVRRRGKLFGLFIGYVIFTIVTFNGSLSFIVTTIDSRSTSVVDSKDFTISNKKFIEDSISDLIEENKAYVKNINEVLIPKNLISSAERVQKLISANEVKIEELRNKLKGLSTIDNVKNGQEVITTDTFSLIAERIPLLHISGISYQFFIMLLISLGIEFGLFVTTESIISVAKNIDLAETKKELSKYIEALFSTDGVRLLSDQKIEDMTKIPIKNCIRYKQMLQEQLYNGKPLIYSGRGGTKSNFSKEDVLKIMTFALNTQKVES